MNIEKRGLLYLFLQGDTGDNNDRTMNTQSNSCRQPTGSFPNEPSS